MRRRAGAAIAVTAVGDKRYAGAPVARDRARPGQVVVLTGPVGGSGLGRHLRPAPRVEAGRHLASVGARAMMDTSDGLALDLERMARASGVRIDLEFLTPWQNVALTAFWLLAIKNALNFLDIMDALHTVEYEGIQGILTFDEKGDVQKFPRLYIIGDDLALYDYNERVRKQKEEFKRKREELMKKLEKIQQQAEEIAN